jgi:hypothetical protein
MAVPRLRSLFVVLADLAFFKPKAVLTRGSGYWRIEALVAQARRDLKSGPEESRRALSEESYWWEEDAEGLAVVMRSTPPGPVAVFAEPGSAARIEFP